MDDRELFKILEGQGPWNIRFEECIGTIFFTNGEKVIEVELTWDWRISAKWNGTLSGDNADSDDEQATEPETKQPARDPNLWANVPEVISPDELKLFYSQWDEDW